MSAGSIATLSQKRWRSILGPSKCWKQRLSCIADRKAFSISRPRLPCRGLGCFPMIRYWEISAAASTPNPKPLPTISSESAKGGFVSARARIDLLPNCRVRLQSADVRIDLGGIAKGFAVDCAINILKERHIPAALVNAGGDLAAFGHRSHPIHIRDPNDPKRILCEIELRGEALATSGPRFRSLSRLRDRKSGDHRSKDANFSRCDDRRHRLCANLHHCRCLDEVGYDRRRGRERVTQSL